MSISSLDIAQTALDAAQSGMDAVSENLANASTTGYVAQSAEMAALAGGPSAVGSGVEVTNIALDSNPPLSMLAQTTSAQAGQASALAQALQDAQSVFTDFPTSSTSGSSSTSATSTTGNGLQSELSTFWANWSAVANSPGSQPARAALVGSAQTVVNTLNSMASSLSSAAEGTQTQLSQLAGQVNQQLGQLAQVNEAILATSGSGGGANALTEQQISLANSLACEIGATNSTDAQGSMTLSVGGVVLVSAGSAAAVDVSGTGASTTVTASGGPLTANSTLSVSSGQAAGLMQAITTELPAWQTSLNNVASTLAQNVDSQLADGVAWVPDSTGGLTAAPAGGSWTSQMLQPSGPGAINPGPVTAANIRVNPGIVSDPQLIAAGASAATGPLDGSNAQAVANLAASTSGADALYQTLVGQAGSAVQSAEASQSVTAQAASGAAAQASATEGVNTNTQLSTLLQYQQMYEAAGKVISTTSSMFNSLLAAVN